jgi:hypothetical protein
MLHLLGWVGIAVIVVVIAVNAAFMLISPAIAEYSTSTLQLFMLECLPGKTNQTQSRSTLALAAARLLTTAELGRPASGLRLRVRRTLSATPGDAAFVLCQRP